MVLRNLPREHMFAQHYTREGMLLETPPSGFDWRGVHAREDIIDPYAENTAQQYPLGSKLTYGEEVYRYTRLGSVALEVAALCQSVVPLAGEIDEAIDISAIGDTTIGFTTSGSITLSANELQDGYILIFDGTGEGHKYKIRSHPAAASADAEVILTLLDPVRVATVAASKATVTHNSFFGALIQAGVPTAKPIGWTQAAYTASFYIWLQTKGPVTALVDGALVMGQQVRPSEDDDGAVTAMAYNEATGVLPDTGSVGWVKQIGTDATGGAQTYGLVEAQLE